MNQAITALFRSETHAPTIAAEVTSRRDGGDVLLAVRLHNSGGAAVSGYRFRLAAPEGRRFNPCYIGATGSEPFEWSDLGGADGGRSWNIELTAVKPGAHVTMEFALAARDSAGSPAQTPGCGYAAVTTFQAGDYELEVKVGGYGTPEAAAAAAAAMTLRLAGQRRGDGLPRLVASVPGGTVALDDADLRLSRRTPGALVKGYVSAEDFEPVAATIGDLPVLLRHTAGAGGAVTFGSLCYGVREVATGEMVSPVPAQARVSISPLTSDSIAPTVNASP